MRFFPALAISTGFLLSAVTAQVGIVQMSNPQPTERPQFLENSYIVRFETRSFDLEQFRSAIYARRPAAEVEAIVRDLEASVQRDQAGFVHEIESLGGTVTAQWWIINGLAFSGPAQLADQVRRMPNVAMVERDRMHYPNNGTARNANHHKADQANQQQTGGGQLIDGTGVGVAILDTGVDGNMNGIGRPHRGWFINGDPNNTSGPGIGGSRLVRQQGTSGFGVEDAHGHGSHVAGSVLNGWAATTSAGNNYGMAPRANLVGVKISNDGGGAAGSWLVSGWNWVAANRATYDIRAANNSFSGSPSLTDGIQAALDNCARNADVLISCSAGNSGSNTSNSQNVWNGLAVGALNKNSLSVASFSARGTLDGYGRIYPDISAVGVDVHSIALDSETSVGVSSGTSMSSPMIAGGAALVRQVDANMTALEGKALLLNNTRDIGQPRNNVGLGILNCNRSVKQALAGDYRTVQITSSSPNRSITFTPDPTINPARVTIAFNHVGGSSTVPNVDLFVFDSSNTQVAASTDSLISYERVSFSFTTGQQYTVEIRGISNIGSSLDVAISGIGPEAPPQQPTLSAIAPTSTTNYQPAQVTLTGTNLDQISQINLGSTAITSFTIDSATQVRFTPPAAFEIATHAVTAQNVTGTSNPQNLTINGTHPGVLITPPIQFRGFPVDQVYYSDRNWQIALFLSASNLPSDLPGIVSFGIGNAFSNLIYLNNVSCTNGGRATKTIIFPATTPVGIYYFQGIPFDSSNLTLPLEVTTVGATNIL